MSQQWADTIYELFPSVSEREFETLKKFFKELDPHRTAIFQPTLPKEIRQGDIIQDVPFGIFDDFKVKKTFKSFGIVVSATCDFEQREHVLIAPADFVTDFEQILSAEKIADLKRNTHLEYFYVPSHALNPELIFDLSRICCYDVSFVKNSVGKELMRRVASLSDPGYYFFLMKLTAFFLRPEDPKTILRSQTIYV